MFISVTIFISLVSEKIQLNEGSLQYLTKLNINFHSCEHFVEMELDLNLF